jgi:hypothetical protein
MELGTAARVIAIAALTFAAGTARASDVDKGGSQPGRAAAHAALSDGADVPATAPQLPLDASNQAARTLTSKAFGKNGETVSQAHAEADRHAGTDASEAHVDAALRAAQGSVAAAARSANADARAAAGLARANAAKANAASHRTGAASTTGARP